MDFIKKNGAGLLLCLCIAIPAWLLGQAVPVVGGPVFSILIGMVLTLFWKNKTKVQPGIGFTSKKVRQDAVRRSRQPLRSSARTMRRSRRRFRLFFCSTLSQR